MVTAVHHDIDAFISEGGIDLINISLLFPLYQEFKCLKTMQILRQISDLCPGYDSKM